MKKKVVLVEDHTILREGLRALLNASEDFEVIDEAEDGLQAMRCLEKNKPDLILLDLVMPRMNGIPVIKELKRRWPEIKILVLTIHKSEEYILEALQSGVDGYCLKDATHAELMSAMRSILGGKSYLSPGISTKICEWFLQGRKPPAEGCSPWSLLTEREKEVLKLIGEGYMNKEISNYLCISVKTVEKHRSNLMKKLDLHNASSLTAYAIEKGLIAR
ncbi:MAG: DNA-binding response regulator [Candidatus Abyssobacteria bacterium SURF_5]|uniref:DNA-binding response regulator n=1 Tax=Abyssobacteria bacterium (strain SURF_5) TaxID=2093360 RepID=A0A3A4P6M0_ABYX5|nr:MAG: DNA-binding response regulator [Candidatus Abyssubacteria bacterium SURF_5]